MSISKIKLNPESWIQLFILVVGIMCLIIWYMEAKNAIYLARDGISTKAKVDWVDEVVSSTSRYETYYHISFWIADSSKYQNDSFFKEKMHFTRLIHFKGSILEEGDEIRIKYDPKNPDNVMFDYPLRKHLLAARSSGLLIMALCLIMGGAYFLRRSLKSSDYSN